MFNWFRSSNIDSLSVSMVGAKLGDRLLVVGCRDPRLIAALAGKAGLSGRTCAVDDDAERVKQAEHVTLKEGVLVETATTPLDTLPFEASAFDLVIIRDVLHELSGERRRALLGEAERVLRPGGRCMTIDPGPRQAIFGGTATTEPSSEATALAAALSAQGFVAVRTLAERESLSFVEGVKRNA